jgi:hypothetical protein
MRCCLLSMFLVAALVAHATAAERIDPGSFDNVHALIRPGNDEDAWARIPWRTDLWQARRLAAEQGKPILLWEMDGHPLGCT